MDIKIKILEFIKDNNGSSMTKTVDNFGYNEKTISAIFDLIGDKDIRYYFGCFYMTFKGLWSLAKMADKVKLKN